MNLAHSLSSLLLSSAFICLHPLLLSCQRPSLNKLILDLHPSSPRCLLTFSIFIQSLNSTKGLSNKLSFVFVLVNLSLLLGPISNSLTHRASLEVCQLLVSNEMSKSWLPNRLYSWQMLVNQPFFVIALTVPNHLTASLVFLLTISVMKSTQNI